MDYREEGARAACVVAQDWADETPIAEYTTFLDTVEPYVPGEFYRRELPCLQAVLAQVQAMHGAYRLPTLLKRVDTLARSRAK